MNWWISSHYERMFWVMGDDLATMQRRYGPIDDPALGRLAMRQARNGGRLEAIERQIADLSAEKTRLQTENDRIDLTRGALVDDLVERTRIRRGEGWTPTPVVGYRIWGIDEEGHVVGATNLRWTSPSMVATCDQARPDDDLPHTDHVCSRVGYGCGIYAAKSPGLVDPGPVGRWLFGVVLLLGKVVEHEHGYRASRASVVAAIAQASSRAVVTVDGEELSELFRAPVDTIDRIGTVTEPIHGQRLQQMAQKLERSIDRWTLEPNSV